MEKPVAPLLPSPPPAGQFFYARCRARFWSWRRDSNPRPSDYKSDALPTELRQQLGKGAPPRKLIPRIPSRCPGQLYKVPQPEVGVQQKLASLRVGEPRGLGRPIFQRSLIPQGHHRIDARRTPRRNRACRQCDAGEGHCDYYKGCRIPYRDSEHQARHRLAQGQTSS